jgi:hypothetical protein
MTDAIEPPSAWRLRYDVLSVRALLLLVGGVEQEDLRPDIHLYLGDRHERLMDHFAQRGVRARAR